MIRYLALGAILSMYACNISSKQPEVESSIPPEPKDFMAETIDEVVMTGKPPKLPELYEKVRLSFIDQGIAIDKKDIEAFIARYNGRKIALGRDDPNGGVNYLTIKRNILTLTVPLRKGDITGTTTYMDIAADGFMDGYVTEWRNGNRIEFSDASLVMMDLYILEHGLQQPLFVLDEDAKSKDLKILNEGGMAHQHNFSEELYTFIFPSGKGLGK